MLKYNHGLDIYNLGIFVTILSDALAVPKLSGSAVTTCYFSSQYGALALSYQPVVRKTLSATFVKVEVLRLQLLHGTVRVMYRFDHQKNFTFQESFQRHPT